ncbi:lipopolysaccharide biosynthesis protein [Hydrogenophaga sp.]|uniref:lipopolysaccharide biosynthesis protein n=1 Tax=Hydrogenophaga sp. TaxID=1904254 RepID=UPI0025BA9598|nr:lipopolysaccharide biosynthesis protein [Hydrogenophaga sp.]
MNSSLKSKLLRNVGANAYGQLITIAIQLVSVPLYLHFWGVEVYGEWLILSAIPAYLALSDVGFASVAANDMTMRVAQGDRRGALEVYQSIWLFISGVSLLVGALLAVAISVAPINSTLSISHISAPQTRQVLMVLVLYVLVGLQGGVLSAAYRAAGRYAAGTAIANTIRLAEWLAAMLALAMGGGVLPIAVATLVTRLAGMLLMWNALRKQEQWLYLGSQAATIKQVRNLLKPAVAFMAFPLGLALSLQGMVLIIGMTLGPAAVVIFSAYRTLTRLLVQVITMINQAFWPEISVAYAAQQITLVRDLHRKSSCITFWLALSAVTMIGLLGDWFVGIWTHHAFEQNQVLLILLLSATFLNVLWQTSWVVLMATNRHEKISVIFIASAIASILLTLIVAPIFGINGAGIVLVAAELPLLFYVTASAISFINENWTTYLKAVTGNPFRNKARLL